MVGTRRQGDACGVDSEQGFSLIEGMIASAILAVGLLGMAAMQGMALVKNIDAKELTATVTLASDILERIQFNRRNAIAYDGIDTQDTSNCNAIDAGLQLQARGDCFLWDSLVDSTPFDNIQGTVAVSNVIDPIALGQRRVTVTLTWMGSVKSGSSTKRSRSITLTRLVSNE